MEWRARQETHSFKLCQAFRNLSMELCLKWHTSHRFFCWLLPLTDSMKFSPMDIQYWVSSYSCRCPALLTINDIKSHMLSSELKIIVGWPCTKKEGKKKRDKKMNKMRTILIIDFKNMSSNSVKAAVNLITKLWILTIEFVSFGFANFFFWQSIVQRCINIRTVKLCKVFNDVPSFSYGCITRFIATPFRFPFHKQLLPCYSRRAFSDQPHFITPWFPHRKIGDNLIESRTNLRATKQVFPIQERQNIHQRNSRQWGQVWAFGCHVVLESWSHGSGVKGGGEGSCKKRVVPLLISLSKLSVETFKLSFPILLCR